MLPVEQAHNVEFGDLDTMTSLFGDWDGGYGKDGGLSSWSRVRMRREGSVRDSRWLFSRWNSSSGRQNCFRYASSLQAAATSAASAFSSTISISSRKLDKRKCRKWRTSPVHYNIASLGGK
jgi:hypothetical protein